MYRVMSSISFHLFSIILLIRQCTGQENCQDEFPVMSVLPTAPVTIKFQNSTVLLIPENQPFNAQLSVKCNAAYPVDINFSVHGLGNLEPIGSTSTHSASRGHYFATTSFSFRGGREQIGTTTFECKGRTNGALRQVTLLSEKVEGETHLLQFVTSTNSACKAAVTVEEVEETTTLKQNLTIVDPPPILTLTNTNKSEDEPKTVAGNDGGVNNLLNMFYQMLSSNLQSLVLIQSERLEVERQLLNKTD